MPTAYTTRFDNDNASNLGALVPASEASLSAAGAGWWATVETIVGATQATRVTYRYPGLSGAGSVLTGLAPETITWRMSAAANLTSLLALKTKLRNYQRNAGRYKLESEFGDVWLYCELHDWRETPPAPVAGAAQNNLPVYVQDFEITFRNMQP